MARRWMMGGLAGLVALVGCSQARSGLGPGATCLRSVECRAGLVCIGGVCTDDVSSVAGEPPSVPIPMPEAAMEADAGMDAGGGGMDAGGGGMDAGMDAGGGGMDAGMDAGGGGMDAGGGGMDAGGGGMDAGGGGMDAGGGGMDAGGG